MSIPRRAQRIDKTQTAIVEALRRIGVKVEVLSKPLDLLCAARGPDGVWRTLLVECKSPGGSFTKAQDEFMEAWPGEIAVVRTPDEAIRAVLGEEVMEPDESPDADAFDADIARQRIKEIANSPSLLIAGGLLGKRLANLGE